MDKKQILKRKRRRNNIIKTFVLVIAFVAAIATTFGVTMSYFGGKSGTQEYNMILKTGVYINAPAPSETTKNIYVVPSQVVEQACQVKVKSAKPDGTVTTGNAASKGLLRAVIAFSSEDGIDVSKLQPTGSNMYFPVTLAGSDTVVANLVQFKVGTTYTIGEGVSAQTFTGDGYYYLMTGTTLDTSALMYEIDTTTGEKTLNFKIRVNIPNDLGNNDGGKAVKLSISYHVIQSDFYNDSTAPVEKTALNAQTIFEAVKNNDASYS